MHIDKKILTQNSLTLPMTTRIPHNMSYQPQHELTTIGHCHFPLHSLPTNMVLDLAAGSQYNVVPNGKDLGASLCGLTLYKPFDGKDLGASLCGSQANVGLSHYCLFSRGVTISPCKTQAVFSAVTCVP